MRRLPVAAIALIAAVLAVAVAWRAGQRSARRTGPASPLRLAPDAAVGSAPGPAAPAGDGTVVVAVVDDAGAPLPARLTFIGVDGTPSPQFTTRDVGREQPGGVLAFDRGFVIGAAELQVPAGRYTVWISHGPEWDAAAVPLEVSDGGVARLAATLRHVVDTGGWLSGDFHVHAEDSFDSQVPMRDRVQQFVADGVDLIVSTDHNTIADYAPVIAELGVGQRLASLCGDELTTRDWGHFGAFPLLPDDGEAGRGAPPVGDRTPTQLFAEVRAAAPEALIDVHHPRLEDGRIGYFHLAELDPRTLTARRPGFSADFDAIEVLNGYQDGDRKSLDAVLADWFAFLRRGRRVTATGNSDTHHLTFNLGGYPRNYVRVDDDRPAALDPRALVAAVRGGRALFTTGPFVDVTVDGHGLGDTVVPQGGAVDLRVKVQAPAWIAVDRVTVMIDGRPALQRAVTGAAPVRFDQTLSLPVDHDGFVVVRVDGDRPMAPVIGDGARFRVLPLAITNPIWLDADGDGRIAPVP